MHKEVARRLALHPDARRDRWVAPMHKAAGYPAHMAALVLHQPSLEARRPNPEAVAPVSDSHQDRWVAPMHKAATRVCRIRGQPDLTEEADIRSAVVRLPRFQEVMGTGRLAHRQSRGHLVAALLQHAPRRG